MFGRIVKNLCSIDKYKHALQGVQVTSQCMTKVPQSAGMITQMRFIHQSSGHGIVTWNSNPCERTVVAVVTGIRRGISTSTRNDNEVSSELAVPSPLMQHPFPSPKKEEQKTGPNKTVVQAVLKGIKQSPRKVNLVAALVRGMRVEDALMQMQVTVKKAAKTVYDVIHSARANAVHNHGLNGDRLIVAEAFVGKGFYKKVISYHAKGRHGIMHHPTCRLTVKVRELTPKEEADIARLRVQRFKKLSKREKRLVPHKLIETQWHWYRKPKNITSQSAVAA